MPELPEVETVMNGLRPALEGRRFTHVETRRGDLRIPFPKDLARCLTGRGVKRLWRRAKYILADLDDGETLVIHLGMSGSMSVYAKGKDHRLGTFHYPRMTQGAGKGKHDHVVFDTDAPARIVFTDHRRFGLITLVKTDALAEDKLFKRIGVEPLSSRFDAEFLVAALKGKKTPIKSALLDQRIIAGLGNIYVCEALWRARIAPRRLARRVKPNEIAALVTAIKAVLREAVKAGGSSLRDHKRTDGELGYFQHRFAVYDRARKPCPHGDGGTIKRIVQSGRSSFYCPLCQK
ncbi:MAG: bifunctional DNA-formamidopyrimidine glycosylase/DNA-(apurinic or apyrimidinic site) lyase [Alphaproteobacteria bacterium]|nr:bifunctional DNA-formamidopyrimidine glycosylase/DNA-(apurinic or apyrimidinic site) lyase [Alphaproteobacteria bacterium]MBV9694667.1 bifunctional DNA-formamidopyrimidine glycosylase/DNA-(apurinic or apyrimidinic site) lyase [Alphaproteobacteria bacterium]